MTPYFHTSLQNRDQNAIRIFQCFFPVLRSFYYCRIFSGIYDFLYSFYRIFKTFRINVHQHKFRIPKCLERKNVSYKIFCKIQRSCSYKCKFFHVAPPFTKQSVFVYLDNNICFIYFQVILTNYFIFVWFL